MTADTAAAHASADEAGAVTVVRRSGGYVLELGPDRVDLLRFRRLAGEARQAEGAAWAGHRAVGRPGG